MTRRLGISPRMLRYRESLGLLAGTRAVPAAHRRYTEEDLRTAQLVLDLERRYDITPAALAFALRVLADGEAATRVRELGERTGALVPAATRALEFEKQRALRWLGRTR